MKKGRALICLLGAATLCGSCKSNVREFSGCWSADNFKVGQRFAGNAVLVGAERWMLSPMSCEGGVPAELPEGVFPKQISKNGQLCDPWKAPFYTGRFKGRFEQRVWDKRPVAVIETIEELRAERPVWMKRNEWAGPWTTGPQCDKRD